MRRARLELQTAEGVTITLPLAGPVARCLAWGFDVLCLGAASSVISAAAAPFNVLSQAWTAAVMVLFFFVLQSSYRILLEYFWRGQTLGKRMLGLRVLDAQGLKLQFSQVVVRNLLRAVDALPVAYMVGGLALLFSSRRQRLGDLAAHTVVVSQRRHAKPNLESIGADKYNSLRDYPRLAARLRQRVEPEAAGLALEALLRRDDLTDAARVEVFSRLAAYFGGVVDFPVEATAGLSDERLVKNVADLLFRSSLRIDLVGPGIATQIEASPPDGRLEVR